MDDARAMRRGEGIGDLNRHVEGLLERQRASLEPLLERFALQVLHHEEVDPILLPDVVKNADVRMVQRGHGSGFAHESLTQLCGGGHV